MVRSSWATSNGYDRRLDERQTEFRAIGSPQADGMPGGMDQPGERYLLGVNPHSGYHGFSLPRSTALPRTNTCEVKTIYERLQSQ